MALSVVNRNLAYDGATGTLTSTFPSNTAGNAIIVVAFASTSTGTDLNTAPTDTKGNTYTKIYTFNDTAHASLIVAWASYNILVSAGVNTVSMSDHLNDSAFAIFEVAPGTGVVALDKSAQQHQASATAMSSTATATTTNANELLIGVHILDKNTPGPTWTVGAGFSNLQSGGGPFAYMATQEQVVAATGAYTSTITASANAADDESVILTFLASPPVSISIAQVAAVLTLTGGTQSISIPQVAATLTITGGTQVVTATQLVSIAQVGAVLTLTGGTQVPLYIFTTSGYGAGPLGASYFGQGYLGDSATLSGAINVSIAQTAASLTFTGGTQAVVVPNSIAIAQLAAVLTLTGGTQAVNSTLNTTVTQIGAILTLTGGTQAVIGVISSQVTQVGAILTLTGGTQSVASVNNVAITQVGAVLTLTGGTQSLGSAIGIAITQAGANLTLTGGTQVVASTRLAIIAQLAASITFTGGTQVQTAVNTTSVSQVAANLTLSAGTQIITVFRLVALAQTSASLTLLTGTQAVVAFSPPTFIPITVIINSKSQTGVVTESVSGIIASTATLNKVTASSNLSTVTSSAVSDIINDSNPNKTLNG